MSFVLLSKIVTFECYEKRARTQVPALTNDVHRAHEFLVSQSRRVKRMRAGEMLLIPCGSATSKRCVPVIFAVSVEEGNKCT